MISAQFSGLNKSTRWVILIGISLLYGAILQWFRLPAALLLGPMLAAIIVESNGASLRLPPLGHHIAQAVVGCMIARATTPQILHTFADKWPLFTTIILAVIAASCTLGWLLSRLKVLPGTTPIWGLLPGAASAMMIMAENFGADARLVAFMQYLRVLFVAAAASIVARLFAGPVGIVTSSSAAQTSTLGLPGLDFLQMIHWLPFAETMVIALVGIVLGPISRIPAGILLIPMTLGAALNLNGVVQIELPQPVLAISYAFLGWSVGLRFTPDVIKHAARALPQTALAISLLMTFCAGLAFILVTTLKIDPLTAYLATSPGGMDSIAIIAASSKVDVPFVMALQTVRFLLVLSLGPIASKFVARQIARPSTAVQTTSPIDKKLLEQAREDEGELD